MAKSKSRKKSHRRYYDTSSESMSDTSSLSDSSDSSSSSDSSDSCIRYYKNHRKGRSRKSIRKSRRRCRAHRRQPIWMTHIHHTRSPVYTPARFSHVPAENEYQKQTRLYNTDENFRLKNDLVDFDFYRRYGE